MVYKTGFEPYTFSVHSANWAINTALSYYITFFHVSVPFFEIYVLLYK